MPKNNYYISYTRQKRITTRQNTGLFLQGFSFTATLFVVSVILLGGLYLYITNTSIVYGAQLTALEKNITALEQEHVELNIALARLRTDDALAETIKEQQLTRASQQRYITTTHARFAYFNQE